MSKSTIFNLTNPGRRKFVKTSALAAGGVLLVPSMLAAKAHIDGDDTIKVALIGCGGRGTGAAVQALMTKQNVRLVAMADAFRDRLDEAYNVITADDISDWSGAEGKLKPVCRCPRNTSSPALTATKKQSPWPMW
jgi:shikimate 5-dehydrogenase